MFEPCFRMSLEKVKVFLRLRKEDEPVPSSSEDFGTFLTGNDTPTTSYSFVRGDEEDTKCCYYAPPNGEAKMFRCHHFFPSSSSQEDVFEEAALPNLNSVLQGFNSTIMAYGVTSTGKVSYDFIVFSLCFGEFLNKTKNYILWMDEWI